MAAERSISPQTPSSRRSSIFLHSRSHSLQSTMNLHHLGISSPLSPLRKQFIHRRTFSNSQNGLTNYQEDELRSPRFSNNYDPGAREEEEEEDEEAEKGHEPAGLASWSLADESKEMLVDRLNDLVQRMSSCKLRDEDVQVMHGEMDRMEDVVAHAARASGNTQRPSMRHLGHRRRGSSWSDVEDFFGPALSPSMLTGSPVWSAASPVRDRLSAVTEMARHSDEGELAPGTSTVEQQQQQQQQDTVEEMAGGPPQLLSPEVSTEAERLSEELALVIKNFQERREESDHIQSLLFEGMERSAERIVKLETMNEQLIDQIHHLKDMLSGNDSALYRLRLHLKGIEALCQDYINEDTDPDLLRSVQNWKEDCRRLRKQWASREHDYSDLSLASLGSGHGGGGGGGSEELLIKDTIASRTTTTTTTTVMTSSPSPARRP